MEMLKLIMRGACLCAAAGAQAQSGGLSGPQIRDLVAGATIEIEAPLGNRLPVSYKPDGQVSGEARGLAFYLGAPTDTGRWWVTSDQLCHRWSRWFDSEPQCLRLAKEGRTIYWQSQDGKTGTAVVTVPAPVRTAAPAPRAQPEEKMRMAAAAMLPVPRASAEPPTPPALAESVVEPPKPAEQRAIAEAAHAPAPIAPALAAPALAAPTKSAAPVDAKPQPEPKRAAQPVFIVANVARYDVLNVRSGPSADFDVVGELQPGSRGVTITGDCRSVWCPVRHQSTNGWVNRMYLATEEPGDLLAPDPTRGSASPVLRESPVAPRACLTPAARALLERIEEKFGPVKVVSTCRPGATIAGTGRLSRHASGNAVDFDAGSRKAEIVAWLIDNHHDGGTMTYAGMDHIHVDIGPHFVSIAGGQHSASWRNNGRDLPGRVRASGDE
jgi:hypothetical protein